MGQFGGGVCEDLQCPPGEILGPEDIKAKFGVEPTQIVDYIALAGDTSDNIPGVPGVGEVTACKLLEQFGSLEKIYKHLDEVKGEKLKEKLQLGKESAFMSQELATLHADIPLNVKFDDLAVQELIVRDCLKYSARWNFANCG